MRQLPLKMHAVPDPKSVDYRIMIAMEELVGEEWAEWYRLTPLERWRESQKLWQSSGPVRTSIFDPDFHSVLHEPSFP